MPAAQLAALRRIPGATVWPSVTYHAQLNRTPQLIGATTVWGPTLATAGEGVKIGIIDDGLDQSHVFFSPAGFTYPAGFPKGNAQFTTPKVIVAKAFAPLQARMEVREHAVRPGELRPRDERRGHRRRRPRHARDGPERPRARIRHRAERVPRQLQGAHRADGRLRARRQLAGDREGDRGSRQGRHGRDQPLARRARDRADAGHRRAGDQQRRRRGRRPGDRGRQRLRRRGQGLGRLARQRGEGDHRRRVERRRRRARQT